MSPYLRMALIAGIFAAGAAAGYAIKANSAAAQIADLDVAAAAGTATRATAYAEDSEKTAVKETVHAGAIQKASDDFTQNAPARAVDLAAELAAAGRLLDGTKDRAARDRAKANADAAACSRLADRSAALDQQLAEGVGVVAQLRGDLARRDGEVALQGAVIDAYRAVLAP